MKTRLLGLLLVVGLLIGSPASLFAQVPDLEGNYIANGGSTTWEDWEFTEAGKEAFDTYNFATDDPALQCLASSWQRVWLNPKRPFTDYPGGEPGPSLVRVGGSGSTYSADRSDAGQPAARVDRRAAGAGALRGLV